MTAKNNLAIFEDYKIRRHYDEENEIWYFSDTGSLHILFQRNLICKDYPVRLQ